MNRHIGMTLGALVVLTWVACASYLIFDQFLDFEDPDGFPDWVVLMELAIWATQMPLIILVACGVSLILIWTVDWRSRLRGLARVWLPVGLTLVSTGVIAALWTAFQKSENFIHLVAGTDSQFSADHAKRELIWSGRIGYFMPNIVFGYVSTQPVGKWTLVLKDVPGGSVDASNALVGLADDHGIRTARVDGECYSMCANVWVSFPNLEIVEGSVLGWHGLYDAETGEPMRASIDNSLLPFLIERGIPESLATAWVNLPIDQFHEMTVDQIDALNVELTILNGGN